MPNISKATIQVVITRRNKEALELLLKKYGGDRTLYGYLEDAYQNSGKGMILSGFCKHFQTEQKYWFVVLFSNWASWTHFYY